MKTISPLLERTDAGLDRSVGYAEILEAYPVSRSTIERAWRGPWPNGEPKLPEPGKLGSRALWPAAIVNAWGRLFFAHMFEQSAARLESLAKSDPADLEPEQLEDQALDLAALALSKRTGISVDPNDLSLHLIQRLTADDFISLATQEHAGHSAYLAQLTGDQAVVVAATLLPQLRSALMDAASPRAREGMNDPSLLKMDFRMISNFLILFELATRLTADGMQLRTGQTALERFAEFDQGRAFVLSAWLFPELLPLILQGAKATDREVFSNPDRLRDLAMAALDDDKWAKRQPDLLARQRGDGHSQAPPTPPTAGSDKRA